MATFIETTSAGRPLYVVRWAYRDRSIDGKPYDQRTFRDEREATKFHKGLERLDVQVGAGRRTKIATIADAWLEHHVPTTSLRNQADAEQCVRIAITPGLGTKVADRLTTGDITAWQRMLVREGYPHLDHRGRRRAARPEAIPTANKRLRHLRAMMRWARLENLTTCRSIDDVPELRDTRPAEQRRPGARPYTLDELDALEAGCSTMLDATLVLVAAHSGLRRSELFALCWDAVDLDEGLIHVRRSLDADGSFKEPKTYERRTVPVFDEGLIPLRRWRDHAPDTALVFPAIDGGPLHTTWDSSHIPGIRERSGIHLQLNECRDTYATRLIVECNASEAEVTIAVGHENIQTTRRHYAAWLAPDRQMLRERGNQSIALLRERMQSA